MHVYNVQLIALWKIFLFSILFLNSQSLTLNLSDFSKKNSLNSSFRCLRKKKINMTSIALQFIII